MIDPHNRPLLGKDDLILRAPIAADVDAKRAARAIGLFDPDCLGQGIGTAAMRLILDHAFGALNLHRVALRVIDYNARAIAAYTKLGFQIEGRERQAARVGGDYRDDIIMGLLASEWQT